MNSGKLLLGKAKDNPEPIKSNHIIKEIIMAKVTNTLILHEEHVEILCETVNYKHIVLLDIDDISKVGKMRITKAGYAYTTVGSKSVAHVVMNHISNSETVVDHINGNSLDNRKSNLRVVTQQQNSQNKKRFVRNNTGTVGISYRKNGKYEYYRVSLTDRSSGLSKNKQGSRITKQFNINKLGKERAFAEAKTFLEKKKAELGYLI